MYDVSVAEGHFLWGSVMYGYLIYDSLFTAAFYSAVGSPSFVAHHVLGLACCCMGLYHNKCAPALAVLCEVIGEPIKRLT